MDDLFADVKVGDVFFTRGNFGRSLSRHVVIRTTSARLYAKAHGVGEHAYAKKDGYEVGGVSMRGEGRVRALLATPELLAQYDRQETVEAAKLALRQAGNILRIAARDGGDEAVRLAALLPPELKGE